MDNKKNSSKGIFVRIAGHPKRVFVVVAFLVAGGFFGWRVFSGREKKPQLQTAAVERGTIISSVSASGNILASNITSVTSKASGVVKEIYVKDGDLVSQGQEIAKIDLDLDGQQAQAQAYSAYLSAKNNLASAQVTQYTLQATMFDKWDTFKELAESESYDTPEERSLVQFQIPEKEWLAAEANYKNQQAKIDQAQVAVNSAWLSYLDTRATITTPAAGTITGLSLVEGIQLGSQLTSAGTRTSQAIAAIVSEGEPLASFNLSEIDVSRVEPGQKATVVLDSFPEKTYTGQVVSVNRIGSVSSGVTQYPVLIQFDAGAPEILPNMAATASIVVAKKDKVLLVPSSAVQTQGGQTMVTMIKNNRQQAVVVETGLVSDTQTEIVSGLSEGDLVVTATFSSGTFQTGTSPFGGRSGMGNMMRMAR